MAGDNCTPQHTLVSSAATTPEKRGDKAACRNRRRRKRMYEMKQRQSIGSSGFSGNFVFSYGDKIRGTRTSHCKFLRIFLVCITCIILLIVINFVLILNSSKEWNAEKRDRIKRRQKHRQWQRIEVRRVRQELREKSLSAVAALDDPCDKEALPPGSFHIVVAAWQYQKSEGHTGFERGLNYLVDLGLANAQIFWYRRMKLHKEARNYTSSCNISVQEVLTPNTGRDALPFFHHILETWDNPPKAIVMLHGHVADSWHSSCEGVFARTIYYYRSLVLNASTINKPMMTLASEPYSTKYFDHTQWGPNYDHLRPNSNSSRRLSSSVIDTEPAVVVRRRLNNDNHISDPPLDNPCDAFHARWKDLIDLQKSKGTGKRGTCCGTFIVPWNRIRRFPKEFYEDIVENVLLDTNYSDYWKGRQCYEFVVWTWFGDYKDDFSDEAITNLYEQADGLIHGSVVQQDPAVQFRLQQCYTIQGLIPSRPFRWLTWDLLKEGLGWFGFVVYSLLGWTIFHFGKRVRYRYSQTHD